MFKKALSLTIITLLFFSGSGFAFAKTTTKIYYFLPDHLGGVDKVLDENGNIVQDKDYGPFGDDRVPPPSNPVTDYGFTGKEKDTETGLYNYGARQLDPVTGRFTTMDPVVLGEGGKPLESILENPQALNPYSYALNNPLRYTDPTGKYEEDVHYDLTYSLSLIAGFSPDDSKTIAYNNQNMDENPSVAPATLDSIGGVFQSAANLLLGRTKYNHFASRGEALVRVAKGIKNKSLEEVGSALHTYQDSYSHEGYYTSHISAGHKVDKTFNDVEKANKMAKNSFYILRTANFFINGLQDGKKFNQETEKLWNMIEDQVDHFNSLIYKGNDPIYYNSPGRATQLKSAQKSDKKD